LRRVLGIAAACIGCSRCVLCGFLWFHMACTTAIAFGYGCVSAGMLLQIGLRSLGAAVDCGSTLTRGVLPGILLDRCSLLRCLCLIVFLCTPRPDTGLAGRGTLVPVLCVIGGRSCMSAGGTAVTGIGRTSLCACFAAVPALGDGSCHIGRHRADHGIGKCTGHSTSQRIACHGRIETNAGQNAIGLFRDFDDGDHQNHPWQDIQSAGIERQYRQEHFHKYDVQRHEQAHGAKHTAPAGEYI